MTRFPTPAPDQMTEAQRRLADAILSGPRGSLDGPFRAWLHAPELGDRLQRVGEQLRFHPILPPALKEFAILITACVWRASFEWYAHYAMALTAGMDPPKLAPLLDGVRPDGMTEDEAAVYDFATGLHRDRQVSDEVYRRVVERFGTEGAVELIALCGYYTLVAMTLNVAQVQAPAADYPALPPPPVPR